MNFILYVTVKILLLLADQCGDIFVIVKLHERPHTDQPSGLNNSLSLYTDNDKLN